MKSHSTIRYWICYLLLFVVLLALFVGTLCTGSVPFSLSEIGSVLMHPEQNTTAWKILWEIRMPRSLTAIILGGALSVSGFLLQTFFSNPIAGPYILGISSGAKLTVALAMIFFLGQGRLLSAMALIGVAFFGSMLSMGFILLISGKVHRMSILIICGSMGSFASSSWQDLRAMSIVVFPVLIGTFFLSKPMGAYQLGEAYAQNLGVPIRLFRVTLILLSSLLSACVTAFAGPISFVGIAVPHLMNNLLQTAKPLWLIPACFFGGGAFCLLCDWIARTVFSPTELSISTVTAVFGAPIVIWMMLHREKR